MLKNVVLILTIVLSAFSPGKVSAQNDTENFVAEFGDSIFSTRDSIFYDSIAKSYVNTAIDLSMEDDCLDSTVSYLYKALEIFEKLKNKKNVGLMLVNIGLMYSNYNQLQLSFDHYEKALKILDEAGDINNLAWLNYLLGISNMNLNAVDVAANYLKRSKEMYALTKDTNNYKLVNAIIAKNNFDISKPKGMKKMIEANKDQETKLKEINVQEFMIIDYISLCFSTISDFYYVFSRLESNDTLKNYYKTTMQKIYNSCIKYHEYMGQYSSREKISKAYVLMANNNLKQAGKLLNQIEEKDTPEFYGAMEEYCKASGDYAQVLKYNELRNKCEKTVFSSEYSVKYERNLTQKAYEDKIVESEIRQKRQNYIWQQTQRRAEYRQIFMIIILILLIAIITFSYFKSIFLGQLTQQLRARNHEIINQNRNLQIKYQEIYAQKAAIEVLKEQVEAYRQDLASLNKYLLYSIHTAEKIQNAAIPYSEIMHKIFGECFVYWKPKNIVSGDFYWVNEIGERKFLITADCTGHGVPGGLLSILGISILNDIASNFSSLEAGSILDLFRKRFVDTLNVNGELEDGIDLALIIINKNTLTLEYAGAKRPLFLVRNNILTVYKPDLLSIGRNFMKGEKHFTNHKINIQKGDMLYTFTDGITDQIGGETGLEKFSVPVLRELLQETAYFPAQLQKSIISAAIYEHTNSSVILSVEQLDDQLLTGIRI